MYLVVFSGAFCLLFVLIHVLVKNEKGFKKGFFKSVFICQPNVCNALNIVEDLAKNIFLLFLETALF